MKTLFLEILSDRSRQAWRITKLEKKSMALQDQINELSGITEDINSRLTSAPADSQEKLVASHEKTLEQIAHEAYWGDIAVWANCPAGVRTRWNSAAEAVKQGVLNQMRQAALDRFSDAPVSDDDDAFCPECVQKIKGAEFTPASPEAAYPFGPRDHKFNEADALQLDQPRNDVQGLGSEKFNTKPSLP